MLKILTLSLMAVSAPLAAQQAGSAAAPKALVKADFIKGLDQSFAMVDANKDGFSDKAELEAAERRGMAARKAQVVKSREEAFKQLDKDNNGSLTLAEFNAVIQATAIPAPNVAPIIAKLDTNKDGKVSAAENRTPAIAEFDRVDTNKDGQITPAEQQASRRR